MTLTLANGKTITGSYHGGRGPTSRRASRSPARLLDQRIAGPDNQQLVEARGERAGKSATAVFDPAKMRLSIDASGGAGGSGTSNCGSSSGGARGGRGGNGAAVTVFFDPAHRALEDTVKVDNSGGAGGSSESTQGDPGDAGPEPVFKPARAD
jgi:hypothetical protein